MKADSQDPAIIGSSFFYTLTVSNSGPSVANNIVITDVLNSNLGVDPEAITFSHDISAGYADDASWSHSFDITTHTLALTKLSMDIGETIYIRIPVLWISPYNGTKTPGTAGTGGPGSTCTGDLINRVSVTTISNDTNTANNSYCQPTNVYCSDVTANAGTDKVLTCTVTSVTLDGSGLPQGSMFSWVAGNSGHIVSGANTANPVVNAAGTYTLTVTDPSNGCIAVDVAAVNLGRDTEPPVIACPVSIKVSCASEVPDPVLPSATDNCGLAKVEWIGDVISNMTCENKYLITRTYRATDVNGLTADCKQLITVFDDKAPVLTIPADFNGLRGPDSSWNITPSVTGQATAIDNCG